MKLYLFASFVLSLCSQSSLWNATFAWSRASWNLAFLLFLLPFFFRLNWRCLLFSIFSASIKCFGFIIFSPLLNVAKLSSPMSTPTASVLGCTFSSCGTSQQKITHHLLSLVLFTVQVFILP